MRLDTLPVRTEAGFASRVAAERFGIQAQAHPLPGEYDANYRLATATGERYVLKIMHPERERSLIDLQCRALQHIARRAPLLPVPRVQPSLSGEPIVAVVDEHGASRHVWMLSYIPGRPLVHTQPRTPEVLRSLGRFLGELAGALAGFTHPAAERELKWDCARASWVDEYLHHIEDPERRRIVQWFMERYAAEVLPAVHRLRRSVIHGDANDHNVLTAAPRAQAPKVVGLVDFGDMHRGMTVAEPAVAAAYALLDQEDPLAAVAHLVGGFHEVYPLTEQEIELLFPLIGARLCVSVVNSAYRKALAPEDPYITISEQPAWRALQRLAPVPPRLAAYQLRGACGLPHVPHGERVVAWLRANAPSFAAVMDELPTAHVLDLSVGSLLTGADPRALDAPSLAETLRDELRAAGARIGVGRYNEARMRRAAPPLAAANPVQERPTIHLGLDLFAPPGTAVYAPLAGVVHALAVNAREQSEQNKPPQKQQERPEQEQQELQERQGQHGQQARQEQQRPQEQQEQQGQGPASVVVLRHQPQEGLAFFTLYRHLSRDSLEALTVGQSIERGARLGVVGTPAAHAGWPAHLHVQLITDLLGLGSDFPAVAPASQRPLWLSLSPQANLLVRIPPERFPPEPSTKEETLRRRKARLGRNLSVSYHDPLKIVRGWRQYLYDDTGRAYLDGYNNVPLVGHSHPRVVNAAQRQLALLNTNTRYLHDNAVQYAERLTALMPEPLRVCYFLNSASEANELALRLARAYTGRYDVVVLEHAYHGHTNTLIDISPYKFNRPGGAGRKPWVHVAPIADDYRGPYKRGVPDAGPKYAAHVAELISQGVRPAAFIAETLPSVGGQIVFPPEYLATVYRAVRAAGGVCIADEVQVGFGRLGSWFWGFESQAVVPDIVVLGKPIGNGFPLAAVVTTPAIAAAFDNGMEFFSTFGGNPVACAAGLAVLEVVQEEGLAENALRVGGFLRSRLAALIDRHPLVGDVRGMGLFLGVELVRDRDSLEPADQEASYVINRLRGNGVLTGTDGPYHNVLKIRPPLCFEERDADLLARTLDQVLAEDGLRATAR